MFSCLSGDCLAEYNMRGSSCPVVDMQFIPEGTELICLNENNQICHFYTKMIDLELMSEGARKGY